MPRPAYNGLPLRTRPDIFRSLTLALSYAAASRSLAVMMGLPGEYVVVTMADAARMERGGYEWAR